MQTQPSQIQNPWNQVDANAPRDGTDHLEPNTLIIEDETLRKGFTSTPNYILEDTDVSLAARFTYILLLSFAWQEDSCFPGQARLAEKLGVTRQMVNRYLNELKEKKYITWQRRGLGKTNVYSILRVEPKKYEADVNHSLHQDVKSAYHPDVKPILHKEDSVGEKTERKYSDDSKFRKGENLNNKTKSNSARISAIVEKLSKNDLHDPDHVNSNATQAQNLWHASKLSEDEFILLLATARKITLQYSGNIKKEAGYMGLKNQAPYFFKVVRDLIHQYRLGNFRDEFLKRKTVI